MELTHLSASGIHLFNQCPSAFFAKYRDKIVTDETNDTYAKYGTLFHEIAENIANKEYENIEEPLKHFKKNFRSCGLTEKQNPADYYKQGINAIETAWVELNAMNVVGAEVNFKINRLEDAPPLVGFIDLVYRDEKNRLVVRDYKTSKKYTKSQMAKQWQPYFYSIACKEIYGEYPYKFEFQFVRFGEVGSVLIDDVFIKRHDVMLCGIVNQIKKEIEKANWNPFYCENFCASKSLCAKYLSKHS